MASRRRRESQSRGVQRFGRETAAELRKVSWPTRQEAISLTRVVLIVMLFMGLLLGGLDWVFFRFFAWLLGT